MCLSHYEKLCFGNFSVKLDIDTKTRREVGYMSPGPGARSLNEVNRN